MATYTLAVTSTSANTVAINSTRVKVVSNVACYYAINQPAAFESNANLAAVVGPMIAANRPTDVNMQGLNNVLALLAVGANGVATVTEIGTVYQRAMDQNRITLPFTLTNGSNIATGADTTGIKVGMYVYGGNLATNANLTVTAINTNANITLSSNSTVSTTAVLTFTVNQLQSA